MSITSRYSVERTKDFVQDVSTGRRQYYAFAGQSDSVSNTTAVTDDSINQTDIAIRRELLFGNKLTAADVSPMIRRINWESGKVFDVYDPYNPDPSSLDFYVVTEDNRVFKCIFNANAAPSTVKPILASTSGTFMSGDGYIWKYMFTIDPSAGTNFINDFYVPLTPNSEVESFSVPGTIDAVKINYGGANLTVYETGVIASVISNTEIKLSGNSSPLDDYYTDSSIYLSDNLDSIGQVRKIVSYDGATRTLSVDPATPFDLKQIITLSNTVIHIGSGIGLGTLVNQTFSNTSTIYKVGYFGAGQQVFQSDTGSVGRIVASNTTNASVKLNYDSPQILTNYPVVNSSDSGVQKNGTVAISNTGILFRGVIVSPGSGYISNANIIVAGQAGSSGGSATAVANSTGKIASINITAGGSGHFNEPLAVASAPANTTFNASSAVSANGLIQISSANRFVSNDEIFYRVSAGNTAIAPLVSGTKYFVQFSNSTHLGLSLSRGGARISLTPGVSETGHALQGAQANVRILTDSLLIRANTGTNFVSDYANGDYIRVGPSANSNIRRIESVNSSTIVISSTPMMANFASANTYKMSSGFIPTQVANVSANGVVYVSDINSVRLSVSNSSVIGSMLMVGENVIMTDSGGVAQGATGKVAFSNSSIVVVTDTTGTWSGGYYILGQSTGIHMNVNSVQDYPTIVVKDVQGSFILGYETNFLIGSSVIGTTTPINISFSPTDSSNYTIFPSINVYGDGYGFSAYSVVDDSPGSSGSIARIEVIDPGHDYTIASFSVSSNGSFLAPEIEPIISPRNGHGSDAAQELFAKYAGVSSSFKNGSSMNYKFPTSLSFSKIGLMTDPSFRNVVVEYSVTDTVNLTLSGTTTVNPHGLTSWYTGEPVIQKSSGSSGLVVSGNSTVLRLKSVLGSFDAGQNIVSSYSNTTANVVSSVLMTPVVNTSIVTNNVSGTVYQTNTTTNTVFLTSVVGDIDIGTKLEFSDGCTITVSDILVNNTAPDFGYNDYFNQTTTLSLRSVTGQFSLGETVSQSKADGIVVENNNFGLFIESANGNILPGSNVSQSSSNSYGIVSFANSTYVELMNCSGTMVANSLIQTESGTTANVISVNKMLVLRARSNTEFSISDDLVIGSSSGASGKVQFVKEFELDRNSGSVIYYENIEPVERTVNSIEDIRLVIKF